MRSFISPLQRRRSYRHEAVNIPQRRSGRFLLLCARLLPTASSGGILDSTGPAANASRTFGGRTGNVENRPGSGLRSESKVLSALLPRPQDRFPFKAQSKRDSNPQSAVMSRLLNHQLFEFAVRAFQDTVCYSCGIRTRGVLLFRQVLPTGANGSTKVCWLCLSVENVARGSRQTSDPGRLILDQPARQAGAAFSLMGTRCRFQNSQRVFTPAGQILPDKGSEMLLWASFVYQDASCLIGSRPFDPRTRSFRIVSLIQGEFAVSVFRFRPASPQTRPCSRGVQIGLPAGLKARSCSHD